MAGFRQLMDRLDDLTTIPSRIAKDVAEGINEEIALEFSQGSNAYGTPWKPLLPQTVKRKGGDSRILLRTDALSNETVAVPLPGAGIEIRTLDYGGYHQTGTKHMVARKILPDGAALPKSWEAIIQRATDAAFAKALR